MFVTSYGAIREVTGSMHLLTTEFDRILLDCGMFQGRRKESEIKNRQLQIDPLLITNIVLSHAHIDHCGRIPLLTQSKYKGRVIATRPTVDACQYLLRDSAHIQESDAEYINYKTVKSFLIQRMQSSKKRKSSRDLKELKKKLKKDGHIINSEVVNKMIHKYHLKNIEPLYTLLDAENAVNILEGYPYGEEITIGKNITCTFFDAGHILGSAISLIKVKEKGKEYKIMYTGDLGRFNKPIIRDPHIEFKKENREIDLLILESTYGNRDHDPVENLKNKLKEIILQTSNRNGSIIIPSFAFGRTQEIIYYLHQLYNDNDVPLLPVYVDSPLATRLTKVFGEHPEAYDRLTHRSFLEIGQNPFLFKQLSYTTSVQDSMKLLKDKTPKIVISASGMCEAGRILHHLRYNIFDDRNTILSVGYMARHTLGRRIVDLAFEYEKKDRQGMPPLVRIYNKEYPLSARVRELGGFSAHGDRNEMLQFLKKSRLRIKKIMLVHGEEDQMIAFKDLLVEKGYKVIIPYRGEIFQL
jgi:metallo-beta-lactamase family protein